MDEPFRLVFIIYRGGQVNGSHYEVEYTRACKDYRTIGTVKKHNKYSVHMIFAASLAKIMD